MKHFLAILCILLCTTGAYSQNHHRDDRGGRHKVERSIRQDRHRVSKVERHRDIRPDRRHGDRPPVAKKVYRSIPERQEIPCVRDWQDLWNGRHVRLLNDRVSVLDYDGDTIVRGDEISLLPNGCYKVRVGDIWRIYDSHGVSTSISGHEILAWPHGLYCVRFSDFWRVYDQDGDRLVNVWGDYVEIYDNKLIHCRRNGRSFYYDFQGNERR